MIAWYLKDSLISYIPYILYNNQTISITELA